MIAGAALSTWEGAGIDVWRRRWQLPRLIVFQEIGSTNDAARSLAVEAAPAGLLVMAEYQTAGRGRMGRHWTAAPGDALLLSYVLKPRPAAGDTAPGAAPVRVGIAVARALRDSTGVDAQLKWPNDVVVPGAGKLAGILCEAATVGGDTIIIAGIGLNVRPPHDGWPDQLRATSVAELAPAAADRPAIMDRLTAALRPLATLPLDPLTADELRSYEQLDSLRGRDIVATGAETSQGQAAGIAHDGALRIRTSAGLRRITSATVRVVEHHGPSTARSPG